MTDCDFISKNQRESVPADLVNGKAGILTLSLTEKLKFRKVYAQMEPILGVAPNSYKLDCVLRFYLEQKNVLELPFNLFQENGAGIGLVFLQESSFAQSVAASQPERDGMTVSFKAGATFSVTRHLPAQSVVIEADRVSLDVLALPNFVNLTALWFYLGIRSSSKPW